MSAQDKSSSQEAGSKDDSSPPAYTSNQAPPPPAYESRGATRIAANPPLPPSFPPVMNAYSLRGQLKSFSICGASEREHLYTVEMHTGYSGKSPLGSRPGMLLRNGTSSSSRNDGVVVAAAGDESQLAARPYALNLESIVLLPPPALERTTAQDEWITERMRARMSGEDVTFCFSVEVGNGEKRRCERFEWRKIKKGVDGDDEAKAGGFKLLRRSEPSGNGASSGGSGSGGMSSNDQAAALSSPSSSAVESGGGEVVALLTWAKSIFSLKHIFTLRLLGSGLSGALGDRWSLMVLMTSLRLLGLRLNGRTSKFSVAMGEKVRGK